MSLLDTSPQLPAEAGDVTLKMFYVQCLAAGSYIVAHEGFALVVDPLRDVEQYVVFLREHSLVLKGILLSHAHADYLGGHAELSRRLGATIFYGHRVPRPHDLPFTPGDGEEGRKEQQGTLEGGAAGPGVEATTPGEAAALDALARSRAPVHEGDLLHLSAMVRVRAMETPGHTPGCVTWVLEKRLAYRWTNLAAFTGDTLFIGSCGRPDLVGLLGFTREAMARMMRESLRRLARELSANCLVLPAHGAGSPCGKAMSDRLFDSLGGQLSTNPALRLAVAEGAEAEAGFVSYLVGSVAEGGDEEAPEYFQLCVARNIGCAAANLLEQGHAIPTRGADWLAEVQRAKKRVRVIDVREPDQYHPCHAVDSYNFPLGTHGGIIVGHEDGNFSLWLGKLFHWAAEEVALVVDAERRLEALTRIGRIGVLRNLIGVVEAEVLETQGEAAGVQMASRRRWTAEQLKREPEQRFLDFRTPGEFRCPRKGTVRGAVNIELASEQDLARAAEEASLTKDVKYVGFCEGGFRSSIAASMLRRRGYDVDDVKMGLLTFTENLPERTTLGVKRTLQA